MTTIYRYVLEGAINDIELPKGAEVLSVGTTFLDSEISIWVKVDTTAPTETRRFLVFGTGANMEDVTNFETKFIGTIQKKNMYAFHIFEVNNK